MIAFNYSHSCDLCSTEQSSSPLPTKHLFLMVVIISDMVSHSWKHVLVTTPVWGWLKLWGLGCAVCAVIKHLIFVDVFVT